MSETQERPRIVRVFSDWDRRNALALAVAFVHASEGKSCGKDSHMAEQAVAHQQAWAEAESKMKQQLEQQELEFAYLRERLRHLQASDRCTDAKTEATLGRSPSDAHDGGQLRLRLLHWLKEVGSMRGAALTPPALRSAIQLLESMLDVVAWSGDGDADVHSAPSIGRVLREVLLAMKNAPLGHAQTQVSSGHLLPAKNACRKP
eukprot:3520197-Pleurochrysis_carterae.AAC.2